MQGAWVWALVWEDPTCCRATKPVLRNKRGHGNEKPALHSEEQPPLATIRETPRAAMKDPTQPKKKDKKNFYIDYLLQFPQLPCEGWQISLTNEETEA